MGKATRWLKNLLGGGSHKENKDVPNPISNISNYPLEKKRWSFGKPSRDRDTPLRATTKQPTISSSGWLKSLYDETEREQSKHAIAVAAATAAAADAAVAAAQAAVEVVRLTSQGRVMSNVFRLGTEVNAGVVTIALAAVKIQTAFRGFLAKKALRALKALVKLQALVRGYLVRKQATATLHSMQAMIRAQAMAQKARNLIRNDRNLINNDQYRHRRSLQERYDDTRSEHGGSYYNRRLSGSLEAGMDRSPKIVEIDTVRPKSRSSRRTSPPYFDPSEDLPPISIPNSRNLQDYDWCRYSVTAQSTPRYMNSSNIMPVTPAKSVANIKNSPNYMVNTQSFEAKVRSQSAPKQRPEPLCLNRKRMPLSEMMVESRASLSGVGMQKSCYKAQQEAFNFKSVVVERLDRSTDLGREMERESYLQWKW